MQRAARSLMIAEQEELDWEVYRLYGLIDEDLTYPTLLIQTAPSGPSLPGIALGERAFEIALARKVPGWHGDDRVVCPPWLYADH